MRKERILPVASWACQYASTVTPRSPSPTVEYARSLVLVPEARRPIVNVQPGANMAETGLNLVWGVNFPTASAALHRERRLQKQPFCHIGVTHTRLVEPPDRPSRN
jgi:hypothetical protein